MRIDWKSFKKFLDSTKLYRFLNYMELDASYYIWIYYEGESFAAMLDKGTVECEVFINQYKSLAILKNDLTEDGMKYSRTVFVGQMKMMLCLFSLIQTSTMNSNDDTGFITIRLRNSLGEITQVSSEAVYTEIDFCPHPTQGYGLYGGSIETVDDIEAEFLSKFLVNAILAPDIPASMGGQIYFIRNRSLRLPQDVVSRHAINVGDIPGGIPGINVLRISIKHEIGIKKKFQIEIQYYI